MAIYTKTGDKGTTGNLLGQRISKGSNFIELQGSIDELNSNIGYLNCLINKSFSINTDEKNRLNENLIEIQNALFNMGVEISLDFTNKKIKQKHIDYIEKEIDRMTAIMPAQKKFILYSGGEEGTYAHVVRAVTRRAERIFVRFLDEKNLEEYPLSYLYINRLSDYFFTLSRFLNFIGDKKETIMKEWSE